MRWCGGCRRRRGGGGEARREGYGREVRCRRRWVFWRGGMEVYVFGARTTRGRSAADCRDCLQRCSSPRTKQLYTRREAGRGEEASKELCALAVWHARRSMENSISSSSRSSLSTHHTEHVLYPGGYMAAERYLRACIAAFAPSAPQPRARSVRSSALGMFYVNVEKEKNPSGLSCRPSPRVTRAASVIELLSQ